MKLIGALLLLGLIAYLLTGCSEPFEKTRVTVPTLESSTSYDLVVMGDNRPDNTMLARFLLLTNATHVDTLVHMGDMVEFASVLGYLSVQETIDQYLDSNIAFHPVVGNHDVDGAAGNTAETLTLFNFFFDQPNDNGYRVISTDKAHLIILNSYLPTEEKRIGPTQLAWLEATLSSLSRDKSILVFVHHPIFSAGAHPPVTNRDDLHALFVAQGVRAVFSGHEHLFYHTVQDSIDYYVTGGAGSPLHYIDGASSVHHMLGVVSSPNFKVEVITQEGARFP